MATMTEHVTCRRARYVDNGARMGSIFACSRCGEELAFIHHRGAVVLRPELVRLERGGIPTFGLSAERHAAGRPASRWWERASGVRRRFGKGSGMRRWVALPVAVRCPRPECGVFQHLHPEPDTIGA